MYRNKEELFPEILVLTDIHINEITVYKGSSNAYKYNEMVWQADVTTLT